MRNAVAAVVLSTGLAACATSPGGEQNLVDRAINAMGGAEAIAKVKTVEVRGTVKHWEPEQSEVPGGAPRFAAESNFRTIADSASGTVRRDWEKNFAYPAPRTYKFSEIVTPDAGFVYGVDSTGRNSQSQKMSPPGHSMSSLRLAATQRELRRVSPGLLIAMKNNPSRVTPAGTLRAGGANLAALAYEERNVRYLVGFDPATGLPARIRTQDYDNIWGDVDYDLVLSEWRDFGGVKVATRQQYELNGRLVEDKHLAYVQPNAPVPAGHFDVPAALRANAAKPATGNVPYQWVIRRQFIGTYMDSENRSYDASVAKGLRLQELAPGVQHVVGGSHNSLLVEMSDHLIVFDAPVSDEQSNWVIQAAKDKYPGKPIKTLVLTHHHMDHAGGLRGYLANGANLVVGQGAGAHYRKVLAAPYSRNPDLRGRDLSGVQIIEVADRHVMSDGKRQVSAHMVENPHAKSTLIGYVPDAELGFVTDIWSPGRDPLPGKITPPLLSVVQAVRKAGIQPTRFAGGHGSMADYRALANLAGQSSTGQ
jgi:glyoxylase-like metal-dependent hydrolase (beta-lactamase superfamily II)